MRLSIDILPRTMGDMADYCKGSKQNYRCWRDGSADKMCLSCKHEDLNLDARHPHKLSAWFNMSVTLVMLGSGAIDTSGSLDSADQPG